MSGFDLGGYLERLSRLHDHVCPRQILGLRMGLYGAELLGLEVPQTDKRLVAFVETDGCFADGVAVATGCALGHRTMRLVDFGKVALTLVDSTTEQALRLAPLPGVRELACKLVPDATSRWTAQLDGYQRIASEDLFFVQAVELNFSIKKLVSKPGARATCEACGEEIINEREVIHEGLTLCRACAGEQYYQAIAEFAGMSRHEF